MFQSLNTLLLAIFFIFGRVFFQAYILWYYQIDWLENMWFEKEGVPMVYKIILVEMFAAVLINVALNFYWSWLILSQVWRVITKGNAADKSYGGKADEDADGKVVVEHNKHLE